MSLLVVAVLLVTTAWFFTLQLDGRPAVRYGPYLTEATCEAVRTRLADRVPPRTPSSPCFKVIVQENDQLGE
jgi:hypothetical protein